MSGGAWCFIGTIIFFARFARSAIFLCNSRHQLFFLEFAIHIYRKRPAFHYFFSKNLAFHYFVFGKNQHSFIFLYFTGPTLTLNCRCLIYAFHAFFVKKNITAVVTCNDHSYLCLHILHKIYMSQILNFTVMSLFQVNFLQKSMKKSPQKSNSLLFQVSAEYYSNVEYKYWHTFDFSISKWQYD